MISLFARSGFSTVGLLLDGCEVTQVLPDPYMASDVSRRTTDGGRKSCSRGVLTGLLLAQPLSAASGTFGGRCQPHAAPDTYPRVGHRVTQHEKIKGVRLGFVLDNQPTGWLASPA
jgi:hypothetical protein